MSELSRITYNAQRSSLELRVFTSPALIIAGNPNRTFSPTTSTLIFGARDAVRVDALPIREDVDALGDMIASTGRTLSTIFITHGHGDHFLGSDRLIARFPGARADSRGSHTLNGHDLSENSCDATGDRGSSGIWIRYNPLLSL